MKKCSLHQGHRERIRTRFLSYGIESLFNHEIVEMILFYVMQVKNTNDISHRLINKFKSIDNILSAPREELMKIEGVGESTVMFFKLLYDICNDYNNFSSIFSFIDTIESLCEYFQNYFSGNSSNICLLLAMNQRLEVVKKISFTKESVINFSSELRKIARVLLESDCTKIAVGINHANSIPFPNSKDFMITKMFSEKFSPFGIELVDTVIFAGSKVYSLRKNSAFGFLK